MTTLPSGLPGWRHAAFSAHDAAVGGHANAAAGARRRLNGVARVSERGDVAVDRALGDLHRLRDRGHGGGASVQEVEQAVSACGGVHAPIIG